MSLIYHKMVRYSWLAGLRAWPEDLRKDHSTFPLPFKPILPATFYPPFLVIIFWSSMRVLIYNGYVSNNRFQLVLCNPRDRSLHSLALHPCTQGRSIGILQNFNQYMYNPRLKYLQHLTQWIKLNKTYCFIYYRNY